MTSVFHNQDAIFEINSSWLLRLKQAASQSQLLRARLCLHLSSDDLVQEMLIAFCRGSYIRPHRHMAKSESFHVVEGKLIVVLFDDEGKPTQEIRMGAPDTGESFLYRLSSSVWHTVIPLSDYTIIHETTTGPFDPTETQVAPWSPDESATTAVKKFIGQLTTSCYE